MEAPRKAKLGQRWTCFKCNLRFYDLNKPDPICPKCSANQHESPEFQKPAKKRPAKKAAKKDVAAAAPVEELEVRRGGGSEEDMDEDFGDESEFDLEDLEIDESAGGDDDDSVGIVEVEDD